MFSDEIGKAPILADRGGKPKDYSHRDLNSVHARA